MLISTTGFAIVSLLSYQVSALSESKPWKLSNIVAYENAVPEHKTTRHTMPSRLHFEFRDVNKDLELSTYCDRTVKKGERLFDDNWYPCRTKNGTTVGWKIDSSKTIFIQRSYKDVEVGPPGQDIVTCFGNWATNLHPLEQRKPDFSGPLLGTRYTQGCLEIYCTAMTA